MKEYNLKIEQLELPTFQQIRKIANESISHLTTEKRNKLWHDLQRGEILLNSHELLCQYLWSYGNMHEAKINSALNSIEEPEKVFNNEFDIIDWGCGQALATICFFDFLKEKNINNNVKEVTLIEPSKITIERAKLHTNSYLKNGSKIRTVNKYLDHVEKSDIKTSQQLTLHFFSNILDISSIDLKRLASLFLNDIIGEHYFFCVGPLNYHSTRIEEFANHLKIDTDLIIKKYQGQLKNTKGTIKLLVFKIKGKEIEVLKTDYYPRAPNNINSLIMVEKILSKIDPAIMVAEERIIQFYKSVIELEQQKEPEIKEFYQYPLSNVNDQSFSIDLSQNSDFLNKFENNRDPIITDWPEDLYIGINAVLNQKSYSLLSYIIPFDEIKNIDPKTQKLNVRLQDFTLNLSVFDKLEFSEKQISELEESIKEASSISRLSSIFEEKIDKDIEIQEGLFLALSSKKQSLLQIYSELNRIDYDKILFGKLLHQFLLSVEIENEMNDLKREDLVQITDIDERQKQAILHAFNNKLSVITGPPGTGKTQVILNILANAIIQNKKVLVASKNNKAVDNVKDRFDKIDNLGFLLRFGSKDVLTNTSIPSINTIVNSIPDLEFDEEHLKNLKLRSTLSKKIINEQKARLKERDNLIAKLPDIESQITSAEETISRYHNKYVNDRNKLIENNSDIDFIRSIYNVSQMDKLNSKLITQKNYLDLKHSGIRKIWMNWFYKKKIANEFLNTINEYPFEIKNYLKLNGLKTQISDYENCQDILTSYKIPISLFSNAIEYIKKLNDLEKEYLKNDESQKVNLKKLTDTRIDYQNEIKEITDNELEIKRNIEENEVTLIKLGKPLVLETIKSRIKHAHIPNIINYLNYLPDDIPWQFALIPAFVNATNSFLDIFNISSVTSLSAKAAFPLEHELFDMVVIDEASQCDIASAIPLILRAKQLVVIGDPLQLKHISKVNGYEEALIKEHLQISDFAFLHYNDKSLWDYCKDLLARTASPNKFPIMLDKHYRSHPNVIGYSNEAFYTNLLNNPLDICTKDSQFQIEPKGMFWIDVKGLQKANNINVNEKEVETSIKIAVKLADKYPDISIGIVTPFKDQAKQLKSKIPAKHKVNERIFADTVHKFQGDEKDIMIYSLVVTDNSPKTKIRWIDEYVPNLVNVAVTRARNTLYIVGNKQYIKNNSNATKPLGKLLQYVENLSN